MSNLVETSSHSERQIYDNCLNLMKDLVGKFEEYLEFIEVDIDDYPAFGDNLYPEEIVSRLFLSGTAHSGGASSRAKCRELGIDYDKTVYIGFEKQMGDEEDE